MEALVTALLAIARHDAARLPVRLSDVDFVGVVRDAWGCTSSAAASRRLVVEWDLPSVVAVRSDRALLCAIGRQPGFQRSCLHAPGRADQLRDRTFRKRAESSIGNDSQGLGADDLPHLFEPFWRKDPALAAASPTPDWASPWYMLTPTCWA